MNPEIVMVDTVANTNNEESHLLTITGFTTSSLVFHILRAFLPNKCSWIFYWVFSYIVPKIYVNLLKQTKKMFLMKINDYVIK